MMEERQIVHEWITCICMLFSISREANLEASLNLGEGRRGLATNYNYHTQTRVKAVILVLEV